MLNVGRGARQLWESYDDCMLVVRLFRAAGVD